MELETKALDFMRDCGHAGARYKHKGYGFMKKTYQYQIVSEQKQAQGHMLYLLRYKAANGAKSEIWVGQSRLRRFYEQDRLAGQLSEHVKEVVTREAVKPPAPTRGKVILEPRITEEGPVYLNKSVKWSLPDEFKVEQLPKATGRAYYIEKDGRYCVVLPDGTLDDEWTNLMMAEIYRDSLNKEADENSLK